MFILKIEGTKKIPDYIQIRDESFSLIAYFKINNPKTALSHCNLMDRMDEILRIANEMEYGKIQKLKLEP
jgi:hypothetical protein